MLVKIDTYLRKIDDLAKMNIRCQVGSEERILQNIERFLNSATYFVTTIKLMNWADVVVVGEFEKR